MNKNEEKKRSFFSRLFGNEVPEIEKDIDEYIEKRFDNQISVLKSEIDLVSKQLVDSTEKYKDTTINSSIEIQMIENKLSRLSQKMDEFSNIMTKAIGEIIGTIEILKNKKPIVQQTGLVKVDNSEMEKLKKYVQQSVKDVNTKFDTLVEVVTDNISEQPLPQQMRSEYCPFKRKKTKCEIWANRKNQYDALIFCIPCMLHFVNKDKGL